MTIAVQTLQEFTSQRETAIEMVLIQVPYVKKCRAHFPEVIVKVPFWTKLPLIYGLVKRKLELMVNTGYTEDFHFRIIIQ